jgi:two-component system nitrate/nitrite response regulator NarL
VTTELDPTVRTAIRTAHAALRNSANPSAYLVEQVIGALASAQLLMSPEVAAELEQLRTAAAPGPHAPRLTPMERQVVAGMARGEVAKQTASRLRLKINTIKTHKVNAFKKLGATTAAQAAVTADRAGLLGLPAARREGDS